MLSDNKRYAIIGVIEIYTRRVKFRVVERSTSQQVACITRDCLLDWGVPELVVTDRGKGIHIPANGAAVYGPQCPM